MEAGGGKDTTPFPPTDSQGSLFSLCWTNHYSTHRPLHFRSLPPQVSLPWDLGHLKRVINSTSSVWRKGKQVLSGHNPIFPSLHPQNKLSPLQKGPLYHPWLLLHSGNWPRGQEWVFRLTLGKVGDLGVGKGKNPLK